MLHVRRCRSLALYINVVVVLRQCDFILAIFIGNLPDERLHDIFHDLIDTIRFYRLFIRSWLIEDDIGIGQRFAIGIADNTFNDASLDRRIFLYLPLDDRSRFPIGNNQDFARIRIRLARHDVAVHIDIFIAR